MLKVDNANFMNYLIITLLVVVAIGAILYAQRLAQKEHQKRLIMSRCKRLLQRANEVWDTLTQVNDYIDKTEIIDVLIKYYCHYINQREQLMPQPDTEKLLTQADIFKNQLKPGDTITQLNNDSDIHHCKQAISKTMKILRASVSKSILNKESYQDLTHYLKFTQLHLEVDAYEKLGDAAGENKNPALATNHYKYAKKLLIESDINFDGKHEHIRKITEKNQVLFGNIVKDKIEEQIESENAVDEFGFPSDLNVMSGKARKD